MNIASIFKQTTTNLLLNKSRSFLTILGIIIGVASVIAIMAVGASAEDLLLSQVRALGSNIVGILPGASEEGAPPASLFGIEITTLTYEDALALESIPHIVASCPYVKGRGTISYFQIAKDYDYTGVSQAYTEVEDTKIDQGRFFSQADIDSMARVAVIGSKVKEDLFGQDIALDKRFKINQVSFKVIGVMEERGVVALENTDEQIFVPVTTAQKLLLGVNHLGYIRYKVDSAENIDFTVAQTESILRYRHNIKDARKDDFTVRNTAQALDMLGTVTQAVNGFLAMVAAISLIVGGIGIMNIMFVAVNERTKEIGLRKAVGARRKDVLLQFLAESASITLLGGFIGIIIGIIIAIVIAVGVNYFGYDWQFIITWQAIAISTLMAVLVGVIFGLWPANRASKLNSIKALRHE